MHVVLASQSPRRKELLKEIFSQFDVVPANADENYIGNTPKETVEELSKRKVLEIAGDLVIGSDTVVYLDGIYYNKPEDRAQAIEMLKALTGKTHFVYSGIAVKFKGKIYCDSLSSKVKFRDLDLVQIEHYVDNYYPYDKAGGYGIQDDFLVSSYEGDYYNIMGLPLDNLKKLLVKIGAISG